MLQGSDASEPSAPPLREGDGGRCTDRTCDPTHVKGVLYR